MKVFVVLAALVSAVAVRAQANCQSPDGVYDLSGIAGADISSSDSSYKYTAQVCAPVTTKPTGCTAPTGSVYQAPATGTGSCHMLSNWDGSAKWTPISATDPSAGVTVQLNNGENCGSLPRQVIFSFPCGTGTGTTFSVTASGPNNCNYLLAFTNSYGCPGSSGGGGGGKGGLSGGSIFLIIFFVGFFVYVLAGCIYKRTKMGTSGMEACPNIDFWRDLPALIRDGFRFTWAKLRGCCGAGDGTYEGLK